MEDLDDFLSKGKQWFERLIDTISEYAKKLKESEKWFSTTLNSIGDAVIATDKLGNIEFMNPIAESLTGWRQEESKGKPIESIFNIINEETRKSTENPVSRVLREGIVIGLANYTVLIAKNGKEIPIANSGAPIKDDKGSVMGIILIFQDITERRRMENALKERMKELNAFYELSEILEDPDITIRTLLQKIVDMIPKSMQYPEITCTRIKFRAQEFKTENFQETKWVLKSDIEVKGELKGSFEISYLKEKPDIDEGPFLKEERALLNALSERIGKIVERMETKQKLKENEAWLSITLNSIGDAVIATDKLGNIEFMNPIAESLTGWRQEESKGKPIESIFNIINEETHKSVENLVSRVLREGIVIGLANHTILIAKNGKEIPIADSGAPIKDDKGSIVGVVLIFRDITERRRMENTLRERMKELTCLYGLSELIENPDISYDEILQGALDLIPPAWQFSEITCAKIIFHNKEFKTSNFKETEWKLSVSTDVHEKIIVLEVYYLEDKAFLKEERSLLTDIGSRLKSIIEQKETQQKLNESKEKEYREAYNRAEFYKDLFTHDINNILQNILSGMEISEMYIGDPEKLEKLKEINIISKNQVIRGAKLVSNIGKLSKLEKNEISIKKIEICSILEKSITYIKNAYQDRDMNIQVDSISERLYIQANELLEELFENILINAVKYNENPKIEIIVKISREQMESINYLKMEFLDNSIGIDDFRKKLIFQRWYSEGKSVHGLGLGLSLVKKIIETYNGKIWIQNRVKADHSKGSNFVILIPEVL